jgi:surface antigen-like variable number repeat protein
VATGGLARALALLASAILSTRANAAAAPPAAANDLDVQASTATLATDAPSPDLHEIVPSASRPPPAYGPPGALRGIPSGAELEAAGAVIGQIFIDNENIFDLDDPKDNNGLFRLADRLHIRTRASVIRSQLLFRSGQRYSRRVLDESERILRDEGYFYDAWIREVSYRDGKVDVRVTTRDVWTLNPGFNFGRSGGTNSTGVKLEDSNMLGSGTDVVLSHSSDVDRTTTQLSAADQHAFGGWTSVAVNYGDLSDGHQREFTLQQPFYGLDTRRAAGVYALNDLQTDSLWDRGEIIDQFQDLHQGAQIYAGLSEGLQDGWVRRWSAGLTYDEHLFAPVSTWTGVAVIPQYRRFMYPWVQFDLIQDDFLKVWNHDQIGRTEDFYLGTSASVRVGFADASFGSSSSALIFQSSATRGFRAGGSTLLLYGDFSGRVTEGALYNGIMDASVRYYVEQSKNWLFYAMFLGTKGWRLDLDNQILLGGDNGLRGYPLRYQDGTERAQMTVEQRYFTDWYPFRLFRVGGAVFFDAGRVWGSAPLAAPNLGLLRDAGFGLRFGNARSGLGNVVHVDLAFPLNAPPGIRKVQFLVQTEARF